MKLRYLPLLSLIVLLSLFAVACGSPDAPSDTATQAEESNSAETNQEAEPEVVEEAEPEPEPEEVEPEPAAEEPEESSITLAIPINPPGFNAFLAGSGYSPMMQELIALGLTDIDPNGNIITELATEVPEIDNGLVEFDEDAWTISVTWELRDDIEWEDGEAVNADDVIFTFNAMSDPENGVWFDGIDYIDSMEKIDDHTVVVHYNTVYPNYRLQFGAEDFFLFPEHYCDIEQGFVNWDCNREPLSSGPYILEEWLTDDSLTFVRNPNYYQEGKPSIDTVYVRIVPDSSVTRQLMLEGDVDYQMWTGENDADVYKEADNVKLTFAPSNRWIMRLILNHAARGTVDASETPHPILSDVKVRQALRMSLDIETISEEIFLGYSSPVATEMFREPYACDIAPPTFDPDGAAALLEEAGWTDSDGDGIRECNGCTTGAEDGYMMEMDFFIYAEYGEALELAQQFMAEMWKDVGISTKLSTVEGTSLWSGYEEGGIEQNGNYDIDMWDDGYPGIDPTDNLLWTYYYGPAAEPDVGYNVMRWVNEDFDALLDEAYTIDEEYRKDLFCQMAEILDEEVPQIMLWSAFDAGAHSARLSGPQATVNDVHTWNIADWTVSE